MTTPTIVRKIAAPIEAKVAAQGGTAALTGVIAWALVTFVPLFHSGLPPELVTFIPYAVSAISGVVAGWLAKHTPRPDLGQP